MAGYGNNEPFEGNNDDQFWPATSSNLAFFFDDQPLFPTSPQPEQYPSGTTFAPQLGNGDLFASVPLSLPSQLVPGNSLDVGLGLGPLTDNNGSATADDGPRLYCNTAGCKNTKGFKRQSDLTRHRDTHRKPHNCSECNRAFGSLADTMRHRREVHHKGDNDETPRKYYCPSQGCKRSQRGKSFARHSNMVAHYRKSHGNGASPPPSSSPSVPPLLLRTPNTLTSESEVSTPSMPPLFDTTSSASFPADDGQIRKFLEERLSKLNKIEKEATEESQHLKRYLQHLEASSPSRSFP